jgi:hypothetical protein
MLQREHARVRRLHAHPPHRTPPLRPPRLPREGNITPSRTTPQAFFAVTIRVNGKPEAYDVAKPPLIREQIACEMQCNVAA